MISPVCPVAILHVSTTGIVKMLEGQQAVDMQVYRLFTSETLFGLSESWIRKNKTGLEQFQGLFFFVSRMEMVLQRVTLAT